MFGPQLFDLHSITTGGGNINIWMQTFQPAPLLSFPPVIPIFPPEAFPAFHSAAPSFPAPEVSIGEVWIQEARG